MTKTEWVVASRKDPMDEITVLEWTAASDKNAQAGVKALVDEFNEDEAHLAKSTARGERKTFVLVKRTTTLEVHS